MTKLKELNGTGMNKIYQYHKDIPGSYTLEEAVEMIEFLNSCKFEGFNDWRLPCVQEMGSIYNKNKDEPITKGSKYYLTNSIWESNQFWRYVINSEDGVIALLHQTVPTRVWLVRDK